MEPRTPKRQPDFWTIEAMPEFDGRRFVIGWKDAEESHIPRLFTRREIAATVADIYKRIRENKGADTTRCDAWKIVPVWVGE